MACPSHHRLPFILMSAMGIASTTAVAAGTVTYRRAGRRCRRHAFGTAFLWTAEKGVHDLNMLIDPARASEYASAA